MFSKKAIWLLIGIFLFFWTSTIVDAGNEQLYGTWRLISYTRTILATGETSNLLGKSPKGFINYGPDGRVLVLIVGDNRPKPDPGKATDQDRVELFNTMTAYGGTYTYDGKTITHHVDISWLESWTGTDVVRDVKFDGNKLILSTRPSPRSMEGGKQFTSVLTWERVQ